MKFLTRKDVARVVEFDDTRSVKSNEKKLGIAGLKQEINKRVIRYKPVEKVLQALVNSGFVDSIEDAWKRLRS